MHLTRDQIVDAAIRILDEEGPDALSMRRLGTELGSGATSVYWHVKGKDDLLDLVADRVIGEVLVGLEPATTWRDWMAAFARSMRRVLLTNPGVAPVVGRRAVMGPNALLALEGLFPLLAADGFDRLASMLASTTLVGWTTTLVLAEAREAREGTGFSQRGTVPAVTDRPSVAAMLLDGAPPTADERFEYGLQVLLEGIAAHEAGRGRRAGASSAAGRHRGRSGSRDETTDGSGGMPR
jgi:AcrR family transcriptional regulator